MLNSLHEIIHCFLRIKTKIIGAGDFNLVDVLSDQLYIVANTFNKEAVDAIGLANSFNRLTSLDCRICSIEYG